MAPAGGRAGPCGAVRVNPREGAHVLSFVTHKVGVVRAEDLDAGVARVCPNAFREVSRGGVCPCPFAARGAATHTGRC